MKNITSRRLFIRNVSLASLGAGCLSSASGLSAMTMEGCEFEGYNPYAESKTDLRASKFLGKHITVTGKVYCKENLTGLEGAKLEVWHLSPNSAKYRHQAKLNTNAEGAYSFITDFPGREEGKMSRIYFKLSKGDVTATTELLVNDLGAHITGKHWEENNVLGENLFPVKEGLKNSSIITFNISI